VVIPYCVVSAAAAGYGLIHPERLTADSLIPGLLLGALFGPYYYVFLLVGFIFLTWVLSRLPTTIVTWLAVVSLVTVLLWESRTPAMWKPFSSLWAVRNPLLWTGWCLLGWTVAAHRGAVFGRIARHRTAIMGGCAAYAMLWAVGFAGGALTGRPARACVVLLIFTTIAGLVAVGSRIRVSPPWLEELSDWTYSLYLWHPFFIYYVQDVVVPALGLPAAVWVPLSAVVGFLGALAVTVTGRRVLGAWSRDIIGS